MAIFNSYVIVITGIPVMADRNRSDADASARTAPASVGAMEDFGHFLPDPLSLSVPKV